MENAIPAVITAVGAVIVAIITRPGRDVVSSVGKYQSPPPWVAALFLLASLYMVAITMAIHAVYSLVLAWIGATLLSGIALAAANTVESVKLFSGVIVFLLLFTLTLLYRSGEPEHSWMMTVWVFVIAVGASGFLLRFSRRRPSESGPKS